MVVAPGAASAGIPLDALLEAAESSIPRFGECADAERVLQAQTARLMAESESLSAFPVRRDAWRNGGVPRAAIASAWDRTRTLDSFARAMERTLAGGPDPAPGPISQLAEDGSTDPETMVALSLTSALLALGAERRHLARLRVLKGALLAKKGLSPETAGWPVDPFDQKPLRFAAEGDRVRVWSIWADRFDRRGASGTWNPKDDAEDCLVEITR